MPTTASNRSEVGPERNPSVASGSLAQAVPAAPLLTKLGVSDRIQAAVKGRFGRVLCFGCAGGVDVLITQLLNARQLVEES